jgi:hypothetical protein
MQRTEIVAAQLTEKTTGRYMYGGPTIFNHNGPTKITNFVLCCPNPSPDHDSVWLLLVMSLLLKVDGNEK